MKRWIKLDPDDKSTWPEEGGRVEYKFDLRNEHIWIGTFITTEHSWGTTGTFTSEEGCCKMSDVEFWRLQDGTL